MKSKLIATGALATVAALAPATSASAHLDVAVKTVKPHTDRADYGLDRAVAAYERNADRRGSRELARSRRELGKATAEAAKLRRPARTQKQRGDAARATALVADQQDENVEQLVGVLDEVSGRVENTVAKAALQDTRGRDKAIAIITALIDRGVSEGAAKGLARALAALSTDRDGEVVEEVKALIGKDVGRAGKRTLARTVGANIDGQASAAEKLAALIADPDMPAESKPGLQRAYDAVSAEHGSAVFILARLSDRMPAFVRSFVAQVITRARTDAQSMRDNRPTPPTGGPGGMTPGPGTTPTDGPGMAPTPPAHPGPGGPFGG